MVDLFFQCPKCGHTVGDDLEPIEENKNTMGIYKNIRQKQMGCN